MRKPSIVADRDRTGSGVLLWSAGLVGLVHLVSLVQPNKQAKPADSRASRAMVCHAGGGIGGTGGTLTYRHSNARNKEIHDVIGFIA